MLHLHRGRKIEELGCRYVCTNYYVLSVDGAVLSHFPLTRVIMFIYPFPLLFEIDHILYL